MALVGAALTMFELPQRWPLSLERTYERAAHRAAELLPGDRGSAMLRLPA
jgi:hypothetical protein